MNLSKSVDDSEKLRRIIIASIKGFSIGTGIKGGLAIFSIVARFARRRRSSSQSRYRNRILVFFNFPVLFLI